MKLRYPSPPSVCVRNRIILCSAMPRSIIIDGSEVVDIHQYISLSISQNAIVLSPTSAWSWLSQYAMFFSPWRRFVRVCTISLTFHSLSDLCFRSCNKEMSAALCNVLAITVNVQQWPVYWDIISHVWAAQNPADLGSWTVIDNVTHWTTLYDKPGRHHSGLVLCKNDWAETTGIMGKSKTRCQVPGSSTECWS